MRLVTYIGYFGQLRRLIGFRAAVAFTLRHLLNKINPPRGGALASIPVGPYRFYFPSLDYFVGLFSEIFFKETYYFAKTSEPIRVIDCGANIGMSLLYIKLRAPQARVQCFEPNPAARVVLEKNIAANGWGAEVHVYSCALGKKKGSLDFFVDTAEATSSGGSFAHHQKNRGRGLSSYSVDVDVLSHYISEPIGLLKIDIEGSELDVLEELAAQKKFTFVASVQLEYHFIPGFYERPLSVLLALLESEGFHTFVASNTAPHRVVGYTTWHTYMVFAWRQNK